MPLSKRRRLFTPKKGSKVKPNTKASEEPNVVTTARGRLKGALMEMMEPAAEESDASSDYIPAKREKLTTTIYLSQDQREPSSEEEEKPARRRKSPLRQSYVLKLFDRSVDLSQFNEESPLYPICRAWIANQPKATYSDISSRKQQEPAPEESIDLPGPEGPVISRIPSLLPRQKVCKDSINLNYLEAPPPSKEQLLSQHTSRWVEVRNAWLQQAMLVETRYSATQALLNKINHNNL
ncbi:protein lin-37 homolog isoform X2 [Pararge aegeria]|uniref:Jg11693 protein n=1 Tax=Pararge aegeria aegeria TaxID=348720 RepID=A0A8S4RZW8_9NEOP|nr:protein lin-37 homolog isoform X2 [Pararge aegeria]CAH2244578.1 jg11693 [Pararge aegeria aegeria]